MNNALQWQTQVSVDAPLSEVWDAVEDISLIPAYHPDVRRVEYVSGESRRAPGVAYKCVVPEGRSGWCIERVVEHIPHHKTTLAFPEDSWGMSRMLSEFLTEISVEPRAEDRTILKLRAFYVPTGLKARILNLLVMRRIMRRRAHLTLQNLKRLLEERR